LIGHERKKQSNDVCGRVIGVFVMSCISQTINHDQQIVEKQTNSTYAGALIPRTIGRRL